MYIVYKLFLCQCWIAIKTDQNTANADFIKKITLKFVNCIHNNDIFVIE